MVKTLSFLCFEVIVDHPKCVKNASKTLNSEYRTEIIYWLAAHDLIEHPNYMLALKDFFHKPLQWVKLDCADEISGAFIVEIFENGEKLRYIDLKCFTNEILDLPLKSLTQVNHFEISGMKITKSSLDQLKSKSLETVILNLNGHHELSTLVENNQKISCFSYSNSPGILADDSNLARSISTHLVNSLSTLHLVNVSIEKESLNNLLLSCINLTTLKIHGSFCFDIETMKKVQQVCKWESFELVCRAVIHAEIYEALKYLPSTLLELTYHLGLFGDETIKAAVEALPKLRKLRYHAEVFDEVFPHILFKIGHRLVYLDAGIHEKLSYRGFASIAEHCPNLETLIIHNDHGEVGNFVGSDRPLLHLVQSADNASNFRVLNLNYFTFISFECLEILATQCVNLEELHMAGVNALWDEILYILAEKCTNLHTIDMNMCKSITDAGICVLARNLSLTHLNVALCYQLTDVSIKALSENCDEMEMLICDGIQGINDAIQTMKMKCKKRLRTNWNDWNPRWDDESF